MFSSELGQVEAARYFEPVIQHCLDSDETYEPGFAVLLGDVRAYVPVPPLRSSAACTAGYIDS